MTDIYVDDIVSIEGEMGKFKVLSIDGNTESGLKGKSDSIYECVLLQSSKKVQKVKCKGGKIEVLKHTPKEAEIERNEVEDLSFDEDDVDVDLDEVDDDSVEDLEI